VIVEEGWPECGVAANLAARLYEECFDWLDAPIVRVSSADVPMPYAKNLERAALPSADGVAAAVRRATGARGGG
jgi:pyruvate dehydrogenase E1 component beta subunit